MKAVRKYHLRPDIQTAECLLMWSGKCVCIPVSTGREKEGRDLLEISCQKSTKAG